MTLWIPHYVSSETPNGVVEPTPPQLRAVESLLDPQRWLRVVPDAFRINVAPEFQITPWLTPREAFEQISPKLQEINIQVREETGVDLAKFMQWAAKIIHAIAQVLTEMLENLSHTLGTS